MRLLLQVALLSLALASAGVLAQQAASGFSAGYANATMARVSAYVESVNESGYLIFYPNLTQAYSYLDKAQAAYNKSPEAAVRTPTKPRLPPSRSRPGWTGTGTCPSASWPSSPSSPARRSSRA